MKRIALAIMTGILLSTGITAGRVDPGSISDQDVETAREAIIEMIWEHQDSQRHWDPVTMPSGESTNQHLGGYTALACLSLVTGGVSYQDPRLEGPLADLRDAELRGTYAVSTRASIWAALPDRFNGLLARDTQWLIKSYNQAAGGWDYKANPDGTLSRPSPSVRHFGTLALWAANLRGQAVPPSILAGLENVTLANQLPDGAWHYPLGGTPRGSGSMTAAGLVTLYITQELLHARDALRLHHGNPSPVEVGIARGLEWMDANFTAGRNPGGGRGSRFPMYYLYAVERVGLASGIRTFDGHDWFREGSAAILERLFEKDGNGAWRLKKSYKPGGSASAMRELCFSLLFLSRGRAPIAVNMLRLEDGRWNNRPRAMANWCRWMSDELEQSLNWQVVSLDMEPETWLDAPILCIASDEPLPWLEAHRAAIREFSSGARSYVQRRTEGTLEPGERAPRPPRIEEVNALRRYIDRGGLILAINEGSSQAFTRSMQDLGSLLYPMDDWSTLPADHWAFQEPLKVDGRRPKLLALGNGVRERIILVPSGDLTANLQVPKRGSDAALRTLSNIHARASGMYRSRPRLDAGALPYESPGGSRNATIVRGLHAGNWKAEPQALAALRESIGMEHGIQLRILDRPIEELDRSGRPDLVVIGGTSETSIGEAAWKSIEQYVRQQQGVVLFEHVGGGGGFAALAEQEAMERFQQPARSARRTPVITGTGIEDAVDCTEVTWTPYTVIEVLGSPEPEPRLRCISIEGRPSLFFSREDISHALLDNPTWGIDGYSHATAMDLSTNLLLYGLQQRVGAGEP